MVSHKPTHQNKGGNKGEKVQQEQNRAKGRANRQVRARANSQKGEPERDRDSKDSKGQVAQCEMSHFSLSHKQLIIYFYILLIKVERQPWDTQSCQKQRWIDFSTITIL